MSELLDLYQEVILDHNRRPRNFGPLPSANRSAEGDNPLCGDRVRVELEVEDDRVKGISFEGRGCAISTASASLMTDRVKGLSVEEARELMGRFHRMLTSDRETGEEAGLGKLEAFAGVCEYPMRVKCATLAWHTLRAALEGKAETVSSE